MYILTLYPHRYIPIHPDLYRLLLTKYETLQPSDNAEVVTDFNWYHPALAIKRIAVQAKVPVIRYHDLRRSFACTLVTNGRPLYDVQKLLGHAHPSFTQVYAHLEPGYFREAVEALKYLDQEEKELVHGDDEFSPHKAG